MEKQSQKGGIGTQSDGDLCSLRNWRFNILAIKNAELIEKRLYYIMVHPDEIAIHIGEIGRI